MTSPYYDISIVDEDLVQVIPFDAAYLKAIKKELQADHINHSVKSELTYETAAGPGSLPGIHSDAGIEEVEASVIKAIVRRKLELHFVMGAPRLAFFKMKDGTTFSRFVERIEKNSDVIVMQNPPIPLATIADIDPT